MFRTLRGLPIALVLLGLSVPSIAAQQSSAISPAEESAIRILILKTIRENPGVVIDAIRSHQEQVAVEAESNRRAALASVKDDLRSDKNAPSLGNPDGGTVIVEFFDYNCPYCKRATPELLDLIAEDANLRVVMREWPILGPDSELAARASLAAHAQKKYSAFHEALMAEPRANEQTIKRAADTAGLDYEKLKSDMSAPEVEAHITRSRELAELLGIEGTPAFVIGETLVPGLVKKSEMAAMIAAARKSETGQ